MTESTASPRDRIVIAPQFMLRGLIAFFAALALAVVSASAVSSSGAALAKKTGMSKRQVVQLSHLKEPRLHCENSLANRLANVGSSTQLITIESAKFSATRATLVVWRRVGRCWIRRFGPWATSVGFAGFSNHKVEGDGTTPAGLYSIGPVMYGTAPNPGVHFAFHSLVCGDWWDEDPTSHAYNRFEHVPCGTAPRFGGDSEALWQEKRAYPMFAVIDYNTAPVVPGRGSAIFLHADVGGPTSGCVSLPLSELEALLRWLRPLDHPIIVMGPDSEIARF